jgi:hypothetical protein
VLHLDGATSGPTAFSGNIGEALEKRYELSVVKFEARQNNLPIAVQDILILISAKIKVSL